MKIKEPLGQSHVGSNSIRRRNKKKVDKIPKRKQKKESSLRKGSGRWAGAKEERGKAKKKR